MDRQIAVQGQAVALPHVEQDNVCRNYSRTTASKVLGEQETISMGHLEDLR